MQDLDYNDLPRNLRKLLDRIDRSAEIQIGNFAERLDEINDESVVFHYTNEVGLKGILESGTVWLTDIFDLNDPTELSHGISFASRRIDEKTEGKGYDANFFANVFRSLLTGGLREIANFFTCSFSLDGDELSQWRAYADNGRGYSIGFNAKVLKDAVVQQHPAYASASFNVRYDDRELASEQYKLADEAFSALTAVAGQSRYNAQQKSKYFQNLGTRLSMNAIAVALFFKHEAYRAEREFRLLEMTRASANPPGVKLRANRSQSRYIELDWKTANGSALRRIIIGPSADATKARHAVEQCLRHGQLADVPIDLSSIPYRAT